MKELILGIVQAQPIQGDSEATLQMMELTIVQYGKEGRNVDVLVFPELFITGYLPELWERIPNAQDEEVWLHRLTKAAREAGLWLVFGHPSYRVRPQATPAPAPENSSEGGLGVLTNAASLVSPGGVIGTYAKMHLFGEEAHTFLAGSEIPVWDTPWGRVAVQICYDIEFPETARIAALQGADVLINISNNMSPFGEYHRLYTQVRAMENTFFVANVNRVGPEKSIDFCGGSCVAHPDGTWLLEATPEAGVYVVELDLAQRSQAEPAVQYLKQRRPQAYGLLAQVGGSIKLK